MDIRTRYGFCRYHYFKAKIVLKLLFSIHLLCFDTGCLVILCDITFFYIEAPNTAL